MKLLSALLTFMPTTLQPQVEGLQNENRKFGSGCECGIHSPPREEAAILRRAHGVRLRDDPDRLYEEEIWKALAPYPPHIATNN